MIPLFVTLLVIVAVLIFARILQDWEGAKESWVEMRLHLRWRRKVMFCCHRQWICKFDTGLHYFHITIPPVCDRHDLYIFEELRSERDKV